MSFRTLVLSAFLSASLAAVAQQYVLPIPEPLKIHSQVLNEDRLVWVRTPPGYQQSKAVYPVLYETDAPTHINETASSIDFLVNSSRMPPVIVVGITNTDRNRDLTPSHANAKNPDGTVTDFPTSGGADKFLDFIQTELMPEIEKRYRTAPYKIFAGHSFGGLFAIHALITRPDMFNAYIAVSPSLQWDDGRTLHQAQQFFATHKELNKTLFFSLASEGNTVNPMAQNFTEFDKTLKAHAPKGLQWEMARYPDEDHGSTVLRAHYAGLKLVFAGWQVPRDEQFNVIGGLAGLEQHFQQLSKRFGYSIPVPENTLNVLGYELMGRKLMDQSIAAFKRNVELYPESANVYDSLGEALEAAGKYDAATQNFQKAIEMGARNNDAGLEQFKQHLVRVTAEGKSATVMGAQSK